TDPQKFRDYQHPQGIPIDLIQDDNTFQSVLVSFGALGIIYSIVLEVDETNYLNESRRLARIQEEINALENNLEGHLSANQTLDYNLLVNPYRETGKDHLCVVTRRKQTDIVYRPHGWEGKRNFKLIVGTMLLMFGRIAKRRFRRAGSTESVRKIIRRALRSMKDGIYIDQSRRVYLTPRPKNIRAAAIEVTFPAEYLKKVLDFTLTKIEHIGQPENGSFYVTAPLSIRFVGPCSAYLSQFGPYPTGSSFADTKVFACIEIPALTDLGRNEAERKRHNQKAEDTLNEIYDALLAEFPNMMRVHWGLNLGRLNTDNYNPITLFDGYTTWIEHYKTMNPNRIFSNTFSEDMGWDDDPIT
ncbi:MAG: hypothetical protein AAFV80_22855, partial [Bacteroidota bacterium]